MSTYASRAFDAKRTNTTLFGALIDAAAEHGSGKAVLEDAERAPLTYKRLILGALVLGGKLAEITRRGEVVALLLPNVNGLVVTLFGLNAYGRIAALLNFTSGVKNLRSAVKTRR